jgi:hypothetical protein
LPLLRRDLAGALAMRDAARTGAKLPLRALPGALLATTRATFDRVGPFDEAYRLYYEENDWERRLRRLGGRLVVAGGAHVIHRYGRTTRTEPRAAAWFAESEKRYFSSHFGKWGERALTAVGASPEWSAPEPPALVDATIAWTPREERVGILASPLPEMRPFAFTEPERGACSWKAPAAFVSELEPDERWFVRAVTLPSGETLAEGTLLSPARGPAGPDA